MRRLRAALLLLVVALATAACGTKADSSNDAARVRVFTSTDVWASVVQAVGGPDVEVTAAIDRPGQDPHDYEATLRDKLAVSKAAVVVYNGGGYDDWAAQLSQSTPGERQVVDAVETSRGERQESRHAADGEFNEHVFYDFGAVARVADAVAAALAASDPDHRPAYEKGATAFRGELRDLKAKAEAIGADHPGLTAVATEPVAGYLLDSIGITDLTPAGYVEQSESDAGPSALVRKETVDVITSGRARMLVRGAQTEDQVSRQLEDAAQSRHIPEVEVSETLPDGVTTYAAFAEHALSAFAAAAGAS